jgi:hypothetical protein
MISNKAILVLVALCSFGLSSASLRANDPSGRNLKGAKKVKGPEKDTKKGTKKGDSKPKKDSVIIVGGGVGGTYLAWRLAGASDSGYDPADIHVFERTDRIGGRLMSPTVGADLCTSASDTEPDESHLPRTELGGMRVRTKDKFTVAIMEQLGIETGPFYMNGDDESNQEPDTNPMFARNVLGTRKDFTSGNKIPFTMGPQSFDEATINSTLHAPPFFDTSQPVIDPAGYDPCDGETNKDVCETSWINGDPFYTLSYQENRRMNEGHTSDDNQFFEAISGYGFEGYEIGACSPDFANVLPPSGYTYIRPLKGTETIPQGLNAAAVGLGVNSNLNHEVTRIEELEDGDWLVTMRETVTSSCTGITKQKDGDDTVKTMRYQRVVLALPPAALQRIEIVQQADKSGDLEDTIRSLSRKVTGLPLMKLFAAWPSNWYDTVNYLDTFSEDDPPELADPPRNTSFTCGRFTNDANSHIFAWYPGTQSRPETVMENAAACEDMRVIQMYAMPDRLMHYESAAQIQEQVECSDNDDSCAACTGGWFKPGISTRLNKLFSLDLSTIFRYEVPDSSDLSYRLWKHDDPATMTDAVHFWRAGVKFWEDYNVALQPGGSDISLHIIGEAFSNNQGWIEGGPETAEAVCQELLGMAPPAWLTKEDYCKSMPFRHPIV